MKTVLILVDIQNDFCPGGSLAVPHGDEVVPVANALMDTADLVVATQDWHPADHGSFASQHPGKKPFTMGELGGLPQIMWPDHCVEWTGGAQFAPGLDSRKIDKVFPKGTDRGIDSYSGFYDNDKRKATGLGGWLKAQRVTHVLVVGLATDYCVKATALHARELGFHTTVVEDGCRGVGLKPTDVQDALNELRQAGAEIKNSAEVRKS